MNMTMYHSELTKLGTFELQVRGGLTPSKFAGKPGFIPVSVNGVERLLVSEGPEYENALMAIGGDVVTAKASGSKHLAKIELVDGFEVPQDPPQRQVQRPPQQPPQRQQAPPRPQPTQQVQQPVKKPGMAPAQSAIVRPPVNVDKALAQADELFWMAYEKMQLRRAQALEKVGEDWSDLLQAKYVEFVCISTERRGGTIDQLPGLTENNQ